MNKVIFLLILLNVSSCSFQSSQYEVIKSLIKNDSSKGPEKNWTLTWNNKQTNLYAINIGNQIIFSDGAINIFYKDLQIYKITGLLANDAISEIEFIESKLIYKLNGKQIANDVCEVRNITTGENKYKKYLHCCFQLELGSRYENQIIINPDNLIVNLKFKMHPIYPLLELSIK